MSEKRFTEGICGDGVTILEYGIPIKVSEILRRLNRFDEMVLGIDSCCLLIKSMPTDQAIQKIKSYITKEPVSADIDGELVVAFIKNHSK